MKENKRSHFPLSCNGLESDISRPAFRAHAKTRNNESGLTLIDVTVILIVLSLLIYPIFKFLDVEKQRTENALLHGVTNDLARAVTDYALRNGAYPIPADPSLPITDSNVFKSLRHSSTAFLPTAANCASSTSTGKTYAGAASVNGVICRPRQNGTATLGLQVYIGALPVTTLGLPVEAGLDQYGRKFTYIVTRILTPTAAAPRPMDTTANNNNGAVVVRDQSNANIETKAHFAIITHGTSGGGTYDAQGQIVEPNTCDTGLDAFNRRDCRTGGTHTAGIVKVNMITMGARTQASVNLGADAATYFDDAVSYRTSMYGKIWIPRESDEEYFSLGGKVGVGYTDADTPPTERFSLKTGNIKANGDIKLQRVCNDNGTHCFPPSDIAPSASGTQKIKCDKIAPLKRVKQDGTTNIDKDCDTSGGNSIKYKPAMGSCIKGIKTLTSMADLTCIP